MPEQRQHLFVLALFRSNQVTAIVWIILYVMILHLPAMAGWAVSPVEEPAKGGFLYYLMPDFLKAPGFISTLVAIILLILQSVLIYDLSGRYRLLETRNWLPSMAYVLVVSSLPEFGQLSAPLVAISLFPLLLGKLFGLYKKANVIGASFDIGFLLGVSALVYPPVVLLLIPVLLGLRTLRSFNLHERMLLIAGVFVPWFLLWTWAFWNERTAEFWHYNLGALQFSWGMNSSADIVAWLKIGLWILFLMIVLLSLTSYYYKKLIQTQKFISILLWFILTGIFVQFVFDPSPFQPLLLLAVSLGILIGHTLGGMRNAVLAEALHLLLFAGVLVIQLFPFLK